MKLLIHTRACITKPVHRGLPVRTFGSGNISTILLFAGNISTGACVREHVEMKQVGETGSLY